MILLAILMQAQVDWRVWLYGMRPGRTLGFPGSESFIMTPEGFLLGVGHSRPYPNLHAVAWALTDEGYTLWQFHQDTASYDASAFVSCYASPSGQVYVGGSFILEGGAAGSSMVIRFDPLNGFPMWRYVHSDTLPNGCGMIAQDLFSNIDAVGSISTSSTDSDILAFSLDTMGNLRWSFRYDGPYHKMDQARDMGLDLNGNIYLAGVREDSTVSCTEIKPLVIKLDTAGNLLWIIPLNSLDGYAGRNLALYGNWMYAAGCMEWTAGSYGAFVARFDTATGYTDWLKTYSSSGWQFVNDMIIDENCSIYLAGEGGSGCWEVMCVDSLGTEKWRFEAEPGPEEEGMLVIEIDSTGNLFAGGASRDGYPAVYNLDTSGNLIWAWKDTLTEYGNNGIVSGLVPDGQGGVYVQERFTTSIPEPPYYTNITSVVHLTEGQAVAGNPGVGHGIRVTMAPSGFFISGYEGKAIIYDPAGRLVLSKEIKGKTLISPLSPGVYFVVAGRQRAKVAVW